MLNVRSELFCKIVKKIGRSCEDQTRATMEMSYPNICKLVNTVLTNQWCEQTFNIGDPEDGDPESEGIQITYTWSEQEKEDFEKLILRYAQENIMKVKLFIKQPFASKWIIEPHASM